MLRSDTQASLKHPPRTWKSRLRSLGYDAHCIGSPMEMSAMASMGSDSVLL